MPGFATSISNNIDCVFANNGDFSGAVEPNDTNGLQTNGQFWIGSTALNAGGTHINVGNITSPGGTLSIGYSSPNITLDVSGIGSVTSIIGTANQVLANNTSGIAQSGIVTLTIPTLFIPPGNQQFNDTNAGLTQGVLSWASGPRMHNFGTDNIFLGTSAGNGTLTGTDNIGIGLNAMSALTSGSANMSLGANTLSAVTSGSNNVGMGIACLHALTTSGQNTAVGTNALNKTTASGNTAIGYQSLLNLLGGGSNTAIGYQTGLSYTGTESNNILIGDGVTGTLGESNVTRIGATQTKFFAVGIDGVNVGSTATVVTESSNQLGTAVITAGTGITVTPSANAITIDATPNPNSNLIIRDDFVGVIQGNTAGITGGSNVIWSNYPWLQAQTVGWGTSNATENGHPGILANLANVAGSFATLTMGCGATATTVLDDFILGGGTIVLNWVFKIATLSAASPRYIMRIGMGDTKGADQTNGVYFEYSDNINSGNWVIKTANGGVRSTTNSSTAVTAAWHNAQITINAAASSVSFVMDGTSLGSIATNIPTANPISLLFQLNSSVGTTAAASILIDLVYLTQNFTTPR